MNIKALWQRLIVLVVGWFQPAPEAPRLKSPPVPLLSPTEPPSVAPELVPEPAPEPLVTKPAPEPLVEAKPAPVNILRRPSRPVKWVKPKGEIPSLPPARKERTAEKIERKPRPKPAVVAGNDDPEEWGQYYFRDQILDQLDRYFVYLERMRRGDEDAYNLLRQIGIQVVPHSATKAFDKWRDEAPVELSPWWRTNRPAFGAVAYGFDDVAKEMDSVIVQDTADPNDPRYRRVRRDDAPPLNHRPVLFTPAAIKYDRKRDDRPTILWAPRFLYFTKYKSPPPEFELMSGGDIYKLTVYWDRADAQAAKQFRKRKGGIPQEYGLWIEHGTTRIKVLRSRITERVVLKWSRGPRGGPQRYHPETVFTNTHWTVPDRYLSWAHMEQIEPQEYLRRLFVEAAEMYAAASMGSMIRVAVTKNNLVATFGVEIKRTPYFFKDRDVVLNEHGTKKRIFHIVRPHTRVDGRHVPMHFRGLRDFTWAGYRVSITVPGRDHLQLPELDIGSVDFSGKKLPADMADTTTIGRMLSDAITQRRGGTHR